MNYARAPLRDHLAAAYVMGTLSLRARRRFETVALREIGLRLAVVEWETRLIPLALRLPPIAPPDELWTAIEAKIQAQSQPPPPEFIAASDVAPPDAPPVHSPPVASPEREPTPAPPVAPEVSATTAQPRQVPAPLMPARELAVVRRPSVPISPSAPAPSRAVGSLKHLLGLTLGILLGALATLYFWPGNPPTSVPKSTGIDPNARVPASYVAVLADADEAAVVLVNAVRQSRILSVKALKDLSVPDGQRLVLWAIDGSGQASALGSLAPTGRTEINLAGLADQSLRNAKRLGVTTEPQGSDAILPSVPSGTYLVQGPCLGMW